MKKKEIIEANTDSDIQQQDPQTAGSRGLKFVSKKIESTKKLEKTITKNKVDSN